jgi:WD40 repeat protein
MQRRGQLRTGKTQWNGGMNSFTQSQHIADTSTYGGSSNGVSALRFSADKSKMVLSAANLIVLNCVTPNINDWTLFDSVTISGNDASSVGFNDTGTMYFNGIFNIYRFNLSTPYKISTKTSNGNYNNAGWASGVQFSPDGMKMFFGVDDSTLKEFDLSTSYGITPTLNQSVNIGFIPKGMVFYNSGNNILLLKQNTAEIYKYSVTTPYTLNGLAGGLLVDVKPIITGEQGDGNGLNAIEIDEVNQYIYLGDTYGHLWQVSFNKI